MFNRAKQHDQQAIDEAVNGWWTQSMKTVDQRLEWWREARFGMFVHWGVYSLPSGEWKGKVVSGYSDPTLQLIDVMSKDQFEKFSLPNAINIPLESLLSTEFEEMLNQDVKLNIFHSNSSNEANQAWMITRQLVYKNNYVLQGGLNYWATTIMNPGKPAEGSPNEEIAKYNFRMGASQALGGRIRSYSNRSGK